MSNRLKVFVISSLAFLFVYPFCHAEEYDATVTTDSGRYSVPVEVEAGEVTYVHWPNGGDMSLTGADIDGGEATGWNSKGDTVQIELDDYNNDVEESENE